VKPIGKRGAKRRVGLARTLWKLGYCSRAQGFDLVGSGKVAVTGILRRDPEFAVRAGDKLTVGGQPVQSAPKAYLMMNKPRGLVATGSDEKSRATVYSLLLPELPWVAPVGRLDQASEGLLLFTNDSEWSAGIASTELRIEKTFSRPKGLKYCG
jgi:23S rRNA pseudouridine2605 synthase